MNISFLFFLAFLWFVFNLLRQGAKTGTGARRPVPPRLPGEPSDPTAPSGLDATQREGAQLEVLLGGLKRSLEEVARAKGQKTPSKPTVQPTPSTRSTKPDRTASARTREVVVRRSNAEEGVARPEAEVDQDDQAEQVAARRIAAAEARSGALTDADHSRFKQQIRKEPADHTAVRAYTAQQLRDAVIWREILGPPVALRGDEATPL